LVGDNARRIVGWYGTRGEYVPVLCIRKGEYGRLGVSLPLVLGALALAASPVGLGTTSGGGAQRTFIADMSATGCRPALTIRSTPVLVLRPKGLGEYALADSVDRGVI
jgi:hypothetical protein